jgi:hypothetical protein
MVIFVLCARWRGGCDGGQLDGESRVLRLLGTWVMVPYKLSLFCVYTFVGGSVAFLLWYKEDTSRPAWMAWLDN